VPRPALAKSSVAAILAGVAAAGLSSCGEAKLPVDFNTEVRPILSENCLYCHGPDGAKREADLRLDVRDAAVAAKAIVPGDPDASEIIRRLETTDPDDIMPPPDSHRTVTPEQRATLRRWIAEGAVYRDHWAYVAPVRPKPPEVGEANPIDAFVGARLRKAGLGWSPEASRETLLRRLSLDLTGLPPTPEETAAFVADKAPGAYERQVDRLLASPHYGERMALPWLDAARYADSNGFQQDGDTHQWVWRDWLVRQLNADKPFDQLSTEMLAGDLLPGATREQILATAFNRNHILNGEGGNIEEEQRFVSLFDRVDTTATTWLGLTVSCAQCHDHKYDPITMRDYYGFLAAFNQVPEKGVPHLNNGRFRLDTPVLDVPTAAEEAEIARLEPLAKAGDKDAKGRLDALRKSVAKVMVMSDAKRRDTHRLDRGDYSMPREKVPFGTPAFLPPLPAGAASNRLGLARWMFDPANPLVARVQVNRQWQHFFGQGIVRTSEDLGVQAELPTHPELLDWLAVEFRESGWKSKALQRLMVTSRTYRQSSKVTPEHLAKDPENRLLARAPRYRLPSPVLRDLALASSGLLNRELGGAPVYPYMPPNPWASLAITKERDFTYPASKGRDLHRRSLYTFWRRTIAPVNLFDTSTRQACRVRLTPTASPLHALTMMNDPTWVEASRMLAERAWKAGGDDATRLSHAFRLALGRAPDAAEAGLLARMLAGQRAVYAADAKAAGELLAIGTVPRDASLPAAEHAALTATCLGILNLDAAQTRD